MRQCFETAFANIKPTDAVIVGMFQQFGDQVGDNAALVREGYARTLTIAPNTAHVGLFRSLQARAGQAGRGLWSSC